MTDRPYFIYRAYDGDGRLLYVGMTCSFYHRMGAHEARSHWWKDARNIRKSMIGNKRDDLIEEEIAIRTEAPKFNRIYSKGWEAEIDGKKIVRLPRITAGIPAFIRNALQEDADALNIHPLAYLKNVLTEWHDRWREPRGRLPK